MRRAIAAALLAAAVASGACGGNDDKSSNSTSTSKPPPAKQAPADIAPGGGLAIGMTEINPDLFWHGKDVGAFGPWRDRFEALKPPLYRLAVDWSTLQPKRSGPIDWTKRDAAGGWRGVRQHMSRPRVAYPRRVQGRQTAETSSSSATRKEEPQPQAATTFGLLTWKPAPCRPST